MSIVGGEARGKYSHFINVSKILKTNLNQVFSNSKHSSIKFPPYSNRMSSDAHIEKARTWYFKAPRVACPAIDCFDPNFFIAILDNRKSIQMASISKADTVCFSATESDPTHAAVEGFIHSGGKVSLGTVERWLNHPAMQESVQWTLVKDARNKIYTAHPIIRAFL